MLNVIVSIKHKAQKNFFLVVILTCCVWKTPKRSFLGWRKLDASNWNPAKQATKMWLQDSESTAPHELKVWGSKVGTPKTLKCNPTLESLES
jgi:hypothetical protein